MTNPERALDAMLASQKTVCGHTVFPMTIARYACLDKIESPMLTGKADPLKTISTLWVMTAPIEKLSLVAGDPTEIQKQALLWADQLDSTETFNMLTKAVVKSIEQMSLATGQSSDSQKKSLAPTAG